MDLSEICWEELDQSHVTQDKGPVMGFSEYDSEPSGSIKCGELV